MKHHVYCPALASLFLLVDLGVKFTNAGAGKIWISLLQVIWDVKQKTIKALIFEKFARLMSVFWRVWLFKTKKFICKTNFAPVKHGIKWFPQSNCSSIANI